jgi:hypothetical protein
VASVYLYVQVKVLLVFSRSADFFNPKTDINLPTHTVCKAAYQLDFRTGLHKESILQKQNKMLCHIITF